MKKCKKCRGVEFGADVIEIKVSPAKVIDGDIIEIYKEPITKTELKYKYCFTCNSEVTEDDIVEFVECEICGAETENIDECICEKCIDKAEELKVLSKEELILKYLKKDI
ncbi:MAG: hypothetical protein ACRC28_16310 [Clostridium sp.]|uniref:hypothetical protein n=1 Tax=Clostridium sp. TaxID=1506 RepID=UPI003F314068